MTTESSNPTEGDEICIMCKRPKNKHTPEELHACTRKMNEFREEKIGGAGIV